MVWLLAEICYPLGFRLSDHAYLRYGHTTNIVDTSMFGSGGRALPRADDYPFAESSRRDGLPGIEGG